MHNEKNHEVLEPCPIALKHFNALREIHFGTKDSDQGFEPGLADGAEQG